MAEWNTWLPAYALDAECTIRLRLMRQWQIDNNTDEMLSDEQFADFNTYLDSAEGQAAWQNLVDNHATLGEGGPID